MAGGWKKMILRSLPTQAILWFTVNMTYCSSSWTSWRNRLISILSFSAEAWKYLYWPQFFWKHMKATDFAKTVALPHSSSTSKNCYLVIRCRNKDPFQSSCFTVFCFSGCTITILIPVPPKEASLRTGTLVKKFTCNFSQLFWTCSIYPNGFFLRPACK